jgi:ribosomal protein S18 acetylase RimI-like enzyme
MMTRAFNPAADFPALVGLLNDVAKADVGSSTTEAEQREQITLYKKYGQLQQWVIQHPQSAASLVAYANLFKQPDTPYAEFALAAHPDFVREDLETQLLEKIKQAARQQQATYISALVDSKNQHLQTMLVNNGFKPEGGFRLMVMNLTESLPKAEIPARFSLRTYDQVDNMKVMVEIVNRGWSDLPGHKVATESVDWVHQQPQDGIFLLFDEHNKVSGCVSAILSEDGRGRVDAPALVPEYRRPHLYRALVLVGLHYLEERVCKEVKLESWGDYDSTIAAYTELGFRTTTYEVGYRLDLL